MAPVPRVTSLLGDWAALNSGAEAAPPQAYADALVQSSADLSDEVLRSLPALPDEAAEGLLSEPFAGVDGIYLPAEWLEAWSSALDLALAEIDGGWDLSDGQTIYFCPVVSLTLDTHESDDARAFVRLDQIRAWPEAS